MVLYLLITGCQWRFLPRDFPKCSKPDEHGISVFERALKNQVGAAQQKLGRSACNTFLIVDA